MSAPLANGALKVINLSREDPVWFAENILGVRTWRMQREILRAVAQHQRVSVKTCNGVGKSFVGGTVVSWHGSCHAKSRAITTATKFQQVKAVLWREIREQVSHAKVPLGCDLLATEMRWPNGADAFGMTAPPNETDKFQGFRGAGGTLIVVDEAPGVSQAILDGVYSMLTGANVRLLMLGNPTDPSSAFARSFKQSNVHKITVSAFQSPNVEPFGITVKDIATGKWEEKAPASGKEPYPFLTTARWIRERWEEWTDHGQRMNDPRWVARVEARFPEEGEDTLNPMHWIESANALFDKDAVSDGPELGIDVADRGEDASVIAINHGGHVRIVKRVRGQDLMVTTGAAMQVYRETGATSAKVDVIGVGAGVAARMRELGANVVEVNVSERATDPVKYKNKRAELWWNVRSRFYEAHQAVTNDREPEGPFIALERDERVSTDLNAIRWKQNSAGQIEIESKDETKKRLGRSPDDGDAVMLAAAPVKPIRYVIR